MWQLKRACGCSRTPSESTYTVSAAADELNLQGDQLLAIAQQRPNHRPTDGVAQSASHAGRSRRMALRLLQRLLPFTIAASAKNPPPAMGTDVIAAEP
jgi:hypothetical protein